MSLQGLLNVELRRIVIAMLAKNKKCSFRIAQSFVVVLLINAPFGIFLATH
jgi:hypothetical protein